MTIIVMLAIGLAAGTVAYAALQRWWRFDTGAPRLAPATVEKEVRRHPALADWLERRVDPSAATGALLTVAVIVIAAGAGGLGVLLAMVRTHRGFADFDVGAARWGARHATTMSTHILRIVTQFGGAAVLVPVAAVFALIEVRRERTWSVLGFMTVVVGGQYVVANAIKALVDRTRPDISRLTGFSGPSFPSGHATASAAVFAAFALLLGRRRSRATKSVLGALAVGLAAVVATSRVLLGVHWLTDVLAGLCLGWAWFALSSIAFGGRLLRFGAPVEAAERAAERSATRTSKGPRDG